jgi:hypothetical protein
VVTTGFCCYGLPQPGGGGSLVGPDSWSGLTAPVMTNTHRAEDGPPTGNHHAGLLGASSPFGGRDLLVRIANRARKGAPTKKMLRSHWWEGPPGPDSESRPGGRSRQAGALANACQEPRFVSPSCTKAQFTPRVCSGASITRREAMP